ncbi:MAG: hypothetical protein J2O49_10465, partial [Sciscionella sp.]|nr:hypothetical protein [Sciscionella sp.]
RITLRLAGPADVLAAVRAHQDFLARETLADEVSYVDSVPSGVEATVGDGQSITVGVVKA